MWIAQLLVNALVLGCLYACIAIGFSLVWGVLNVINLIHGSFIVLGSYLAWGLYQSLAIPPWYALVVAAPLFFIQGCDLVLLEEAPPLVLKAVSDAVHPFDLIGLG